MRGLVQGVGFRPFVHRLAHSLDLAGWVRNDSAGVTVEVEGAPAAVAAFRDRLPRDAPAIANVVSTEESPIPATGERGFQVVSSFAGREPATLPPPDIGTCAACLAELRDPADRRFGYPFLNCTDCGPRYTILDALPYDRVRTAMAAFPLCRDCRAEYEEIRDRRYHAEPVACPACGPRVWLTDPAGHRIAAPDPIREAARRLAAGEILAIKGLGGFHLACHAAAPAALVRLRARKSRPDKPLAVMARDVEMIRSFASVSAEEEALLRQWRRPIVLLDPLPGPPARSDGDAETGDSPLIDPAVGGSTRRIGAMLPYTPLHHLLLDGSCPVLVMTSGNRADEPIARENDEALADLAGIADFFLLHDRPIRNRADDSVVRRTTHRQILVRRSRGYVPQPVTLPIERPGRMPCVLAVGGDLKSACCLIVRGAAFPGPHVGDLENAQAADFLVESMDTLARLLGARPEIIVHDLHPDYVGTAIAATFAARHGIARLAVQHHHAHGLACLAENGWNAPAIVVALDGTGYGSDGTIWGGEILTVDGPSFRRAACLRPRRLPGGDRAALEPWRMARSVLWDSGSDERMRPNRIEGFGPEGELSARAELPPPDGIDPGVVAGVDALLQSPACPWTSSAGRLFDAAAAVLGLRNVATFDGQAAMELEELAERSDDPETYPFVVEPPSSPEHPFQVDLGPALRRLWTDRQTPRAVRARRFHRTMVEAVAETCGRVRARTGLDTVALSGGVFQNALILEGLAAALTARGFRVFTHEQVPANDGGLALGQAWYGVLAADNLDSDPGDRTAPSRA